MGRLKAAASAPAALGGLLRLKDWWHAKIPTLLAVFYALLIAQPASPGAVYPGLAGILVSLASLFSFGYVVNDVFDVEADRRAGRPNAMANWSFPKRLGLLAFLPAAAFLPWLWIPFGNTAALLLAVNLALPLLYSIPPLRLKERGICGIVCDALMVHLMPTLFVAATAGRMVSGPSPRALRLAAVAAAWALCCGFRGIAIHQLQERASDEKAGVRTLAVISAPGLLRGLGMACFVLELCAMAAFVLFLLPYTPLPLFVASCYVVFDFGRHRAWGMAFDPVPAARGVYVPPADFNEVWLPLSLAVALAARDARLLAVPLLHGALFYSDIVRRKYEIAALRTEARRRRRERADLEIKP